MTCVDLFCGCGGLSLGFQNAGFDVLAAFEIWEPAARTYQKNFSHPVLNVDLSDVKNASSIIKEYLPDMIIGSPPCQDFSSAGSRIEGKRAALTNSYSEIIANVRPKYFLMENVPAARKSKAYEKARQVFKEAGYGLTEVVLNAMYCNVPQSRRRFFCIGVLNGSDGFFEEDLYGSLAPEPLSIKQALGTKIDYQYYYSPNRSASDRGIFDVEFPSPTVRCKLANLTQNYKFRKNDSCTDRSKIHNRTVQDMAMFQTFPDDYAFPEAKTNNAKMIGNAVPVNLGTFVAKAILKTLDSESKQ